MKSFFYGLLAISLLFISCKKDSSGTEPVKIEKVKIGEAVISQNRKITLWADGPVKVGYTPLYFSVQNSSGDYISDAQISMLPVMDMGTMEHSAPAEQPAYDATSKLYTGAVVFSMPSGSHTWFVNITIDGEELSFTVNVADETTKTTGNYTASNGKVYVVSLVKPGKFETGLNDLEILINRRDDMMSFPAVEGLTVELTPEMPSMGHGSPNNVNPVSMGNGRYKGKVNYTMTGEWRLHFKISSGNTVLVEDATIDILF